MNSLRRRYRAGAYHTCQTQNILVVKMFVEAYEKTGDEKKPTVLEISEELKKLTGFEGILGKLVVNDEGVFASEAVLRKIEDGEVVAVE